MELSPCLRSVSTICYNGTFPPVSVQDLQYVIMELSLCLHSVSTICYNGTFPLSAFRIYNIGIEVKKGQGSFGGTTIVTFSPRYRIDNMSEHKLAIAQRHFTSDQVGFHCVTWGKYQSGWLQQSLSGLLVWLGLVWAFCI